jgi:septal ring factor EnvC (AmiA/AmiB activator)
VNSHCVKHATFRLGKLLPSLLAIAAFFTNPILANETRTKQDLAEIQTEIKRSEARFAEQKTALKRLEKQLKQIERSVAEHVRALEYTNQNIADNHQQQQVLEQELERLDNQRLKFQEQLSKQLQSAYMKGAHDYSKMLLNQENAAKLERMIVYYEYLNNARIAQIESLKDVVKKITTNQNKLMNKKQQLDELAQVQNRRLNDLNAAQQEQQAKTKELQQTLESTKTAIAYLRDNEKTLRDTLAQLHAGTNRTSCCKRYASMACYRQSQKSLWRH